MFLAISCNTIHCLPKACIHADAWQHVVELSSAANAVRLALPRQLPARQFDSAVGYLAS
jgi:hypothetical protein